MTIKSLINFDGNKSNDVWAINLDLMLAEQFLNFRNWHFGKRKWYIYLKASEGIINEKDDVRRDLRKKKKFDKNVSINEYNKRKLNQFLLTF